MRSLDECGHCIQWFAQFHLPGSSISWKISKFRGTCKNWPRMAILNSNLLLGTVHHPTKFYGRTNRHRRTDRRPEGRTQYAFNIVRVFCPRFRFVFSIYFKFWYQATHAALPYDKIGKIYFLSNWFSNDLTHWGRVTHICVSNLTTIGSVNG